jgi:hypothetical protein
VGLSLRFYLFPEGARPLRISQRLLQGLVDGTDRVPEYAGTRQKVLEAVLESDDGKPVRIVDANGGYWTFDDKGDIGQGLQDRLRDFMDIAFDERHTGVVVPLEPKRRRKELKDRSSWSPTAADLDIVAADIWPKGRADRLKAVAGVAPKPPRLTFEAEMALKEVSKDFFMMDYAIDRLDVPALKGFAFEARRRGREDGHPELFGALAQMADDRIARIKARNTKQGTWYAWVSLVRWDDHRTGEEIFHTHRKCVGREAAEQAARDLLREHADRVAYDTTLDSGVETELAWSRDNPLDAGTD